MSELVDLFLGRTPIEDGSPYHAMSFWIERLRSAVSHADPVTQLDTYLKARLIHERVSDKGSSGDGYIQPLGARYEDGFRLATKPGMAAARRRFTVAHELCHTFFYELAPEVKFRGHAIDDLEERLCNYGASELLIPNDDLKERMQGKKPSLFTLREIAKDYGVSMEAMLLRLKRVNFWRCDLSIWHHKSDGSYSLDKILGRQKHQWQWADPEKVAKAWDKAGTKILSGWSYIYHFDTASGAALWKRVHVQSMNRRESVLVLWSSRELAVTKPDLPLFSKSRKKPQSLTPVNRTSSEGESA